MATDAREREREALEAAHQACPCFQAGPNSDMRGPCLDVCGCCICDGAQSGCKWVGHATILAYGRAVREADKEAAGFGNPPAPAFSSNYSVARADAAAAIEALDSDK